MKKTNKIRVKDRFILEALTSTGYDVYSAIYELMDNSVDANSTKIKINYDKEKQILTIEDDGKGMSYDKLNSAMDLGCDRVYSSTEIGYFGVGMKSSCLNLINLNLKKSLITITTNDGVNTSEVVWSPIKSPMSYDIDTKISINVEMGTVIKIEGVKNFSPQILKKNSGVIFYPTLKNEILSISVDEDLIIPNDPLYRDSELTIKNFVKAKVMNNEIEIKCSLIDSSQVKHSWDGKENTDNIDEKWSYAKGGLYLIYGGRYIEYGGTFGIKNNDPWDSRTRIELTLPKELTDIFGIKFNKTNGVKFSGNDKIDDVVKKIKDMFNWAREVRKNKESISTEDEKNDFKKITEELNKSAKKAGFKTPKTPNIDINNDKVENKVENKDENKVENTTPQIKAKIFDKKIFQIRTENLGATAVFWRLGYENNIFIITLNEAHVFFRDIYRNMNESGKKDVVYLLASMGYAQYETSLNKSSINEEYFWEEYWSQVSLKLKHLVSL